MTLLNNKLVLLLFVIVVQVSAQAQVINQSSKHDTAHSDCEHNLAGHTRACDRSLSARLQNYQKWLGTVNFPDSQMTNEVNSRKVTMTDTDLVSIDTTGVIFEGSKSAPIWIIAYVSITCPLCKRLHKELYESVTTGKLAGIARFGIKPFVLNKTNTALVAAGKWHKQAALMNALEPVKDRITMEIITHITDSLKIPHDEFIKACEDSTYFSYLQRSYEEGKQNKVSVTPTYFINGHRYHSCKDTQWVIDAIEYRLECDCSIKHNRKQRP